MKHEVTIDLRKMFFFFLKWIWVPILCGAIAFTVMYLRARSNRVTTYTAFGTMYVYNGNVNMVNYQQVSQSDLNTAVQLIDTYSIVVKSNKVMDKVAEELDAIYPGIQSSFIASTISMQSVGETSVVRVNCTTADPQLSINICNMVLDVAPAEIKRVVNAGDVQIIDYAQTAAPYTSSPLRRAVVYGLLAAAVSLLPLLVFFMLNHKVSDVQELTDRYTPPVLGTIRRIGGKDTDPEKYRLSEKSDLDIIESYAKLHTNLIYTIPENERHVVAVTSSVASEGKSTIAANLAISVAMSGKRVILLDGDLRRACQREMFQYDDKALGLTDVLVAHCGWRDVLLDTGYETLKIVPAGHVAPNPGKLLSSQLMRETLDDMLTVYDLVVIDTPPINVVTDGLILTRLTAGTLFVVRQSFSDHREIKKALISAELAGMNLLGFVFYGTKFGQDSFSKRRYRSYYHRYDSLPAADGADEQTREEQR